jgi:nucleoside-diphosphate-sugar epimerase
MADARSGKGRIFSGFCKPVSERTLSNDFHPGRLAQGRTSHHRPGSCRERREFRTRDPEIGAEAVVDLTCYTPESALQLTEALRGNVQHFVHCGTIWVHGPAVEVPTAEEESRNPISNYGVRKAAIEQYLLREHTLNGFPASVVHPGHLVGPGWVPLNPAGNFNPGIFTALANGDEVLLPNLGRETLHHVHASDVAQVFIKILENPANALGQSFHAVSPAALTTAGYAESVASWFGRKANIRFLPWEEWKAKIPADEASVTWDHIARSPNCSSDKARWLLGYSPSYRSLRAIRESLLWLSAAGKVQGLTSFVPAC